ncbi:hypothetical protein IW262DRAFT_1302554 [Armillaria fumosa]|nr:hypothetical protein IW262DRAFT_1302554 [Armillaria fumosa]
MACHVRAVGPAVPHWDLAPVVFLAATILQYLLFPAVSKMEPSHDVGDNETSGRRLEVRTPALSFVALMPTHGNKAHRGRELDSVPPPSVLGYQIAGRFRIVQRCNVHVETVGAGELVAFSVSERRTTGTDSETHSNPYAARYY